MAEYAVGWGYYADTLEFRPLEFEAPNPSSERPESSDSNKLNISES